MFGVDSSEFLLCLLIAVVVIGPKDLPGVLRTVGRYVGKARNMASQFRLGLDQMVREAELADLEKKWREQNESIMRAFPTVDSAPEAAWDEGKPLDTGRPVSLDKRDDAEPFESDWGTAPVQPLAPAPLARSGRAAPRPPVTAQPIAATRPRIEGERLSTARPSLAQAVPEPLPLPEPPVAAPEPSVALRGTRRAPSSRRAPRASGPSA